MPSKQKKYHPPKKSFWDRGIGIITGYVLFVLFMIFLALGWSYFQEIQDVKKTKTTEAELEKSCLVYSNMVKDTLWKIECEKLGQEPKCKLNAEKMYELEQLADERFNFLSS